MPLRFTHAAGFHLDEGRYFADTARCLEWFVANTIWASSHFFVINGDLTTYKTPIKERIFWVDMLVEVANHFASLSHFDYSEVKDKVYPLVMLNSPELRPDRSDLDVECRESTTRRMSELQVVYEDGELRLPDDLDTRTLKDSLVKVVVTIPNGPYNLLSREQQEDIREKLLTIVY